jgi:hypothetical protein
MRTSFHHLIRAVALATAVAAASAQEPVHELGLGPAVVEMYSVGEVDGDGVGDFVWGSGLGFGPDTRVVSGATGLDLHAIDGQGYHGASLGVGGDLNADGHADFLVGDPLDLICTPRAYSGADGALLFAFPSPNSGDLSGSGLAIVPDVDGDGHDEMAIGAPVEQFPGANGSVRVRSGADGSEIALFTAQPGLAHDGFGSELASAGDVDGDGVADLVIGVYRLGPIRVVSLVTGADLLVLPNPSGEDLFGTQVGTLGDVDGDGLAEVLVGGPERSAFGTTVGRVTVFRGSDGAALWTVHGNAVGDLFATSVASIDDLDGDGVRDVAVSAPGHHSGCTGAVTVLSGANGTKLLVLTSADLGVCIRRGIASPGDVNGDGIPELAIGHDQGVLVLSLADLALTPDVGTVSLSAGGAQALALDAGAAHAGDVYLLLGSASGIAPGFTVAGQHVPLNPDPYLLLSAVLAGTLPFAGTTGVLDGVGAASAAIVVPAGADPALAGRVLHHAFGVLDVANGSLALTSNAVSLVLAP